MALTTTGASADSYINESDADTYATNHFIGTDLTTWNNATTAEKEAALRQATQYIDSNFRRRFVGSIRSESQSLEWPRSNAIDRAGRTLNDVPDVVKNATVELAKDRLVDGGNLEPAQSRGGKVKRQRVGDLEVEYMDGAPHGTTYYWARDLLSLVLHSPQKTVVRS